MLRLTEVREALGPQLLSERPGAGHSFAGVTNDSRVARPGDLFVALRSETRDGHDFVPAAIQAGVAGLIVQREVDVPDRVTVFRVRNTQTALGELAAYWRSRFQVKCIVVTGSVGKTTTKELIAAILGTRYSVLKSPANFNDEIGLAMTLFQLTNRHERAVLETGMFALGEIRRMCQIALPDIGVVTNVGPSHLERLGSIEAIAKAKSEAVEALPWTGTAVLNIDDPYVAAMRSQTRARPMMYGFGTGAEVKGSNVRSLGLAGVDFDVSMLDRTLSAHSPLPGAGLVHNALAALAVAVSDGFSLEEAVSALRQAQVPLRLQAKRSKCGALILDDSYNASPASMLAALSLLAETAGRHLALLGDMLELGQAEADGHRQVGEAAARATDMLFTVGQRGRLIAAAAKQAGGAVEHFESKEEAMAVLERQLGPGDVLLVKASHGMALEKVVEELVG